MLSFAEVMSQNSANHKKKRSAQLESVADVLKTLLQEKNSPISNGFKRWRLELDWPKIVGPSIAAVTAPADFRNGCLFVWTKSSSWIQQLHFIREDLLEKVNEHMGYKWATKIQFTLDRRAIT